MKKLISLALSLVLALALAACGGRQMADGVYTAEMDDAAAEAAYGWRDTLVVEYRDGKMVSAVFESYDPDGNKKSETSADVYPMEPSPSEWVPQLNANLEKAGDSKHLDGVAGATLASGNAKALLEAIEKNGQPGETIQVAGK